MNQNDIIEFKENKKPIEKMTVGKIYETADVGFVKSRYMPQTMGKFGIMATSDNGDLYAGTGNNLEPISLYKTISEIVGSGVKEGLIVQEDPNANPGVGLSVQISIGSIHMTDGLRFDIQNNVRLYLENADPTCQRIDAIYIDKYGNILAKLGVPEDAPVAPAIDSDAGLLAWVTVQPNATTIMNNNIKDKRTLASEIGTADQIPVADGVTIKEVNGVLSIVNTQGETFIHYQMIPSSLWDIKHNLSKYPSVSPVDSAGVNVVGDLQYISDQELTIQFAAPFGGMAYLN